MPNILLNFPVDNTEILATVELLEKIGQVEKGTAQQFIKDAALRKATADAANEQLKQTARNLQDVQKLIAGGSLEEAFEKLGKSIQKTEVKTTSLKAQLRAMKNELSTLEEGSKRFNDLSIKAAKLEDKIGDVQARVRNLASDTKGINALISGAQGITGAFAVAQGAVGLFGTDTEQMQKTLLKVNSAMAILQGLQQIQVVLFEESAAKSYLAATAQGVYTFAVGTSTGALKAFRTALLFTGIGAAIAIIGYLASKFIDYREEQNKATESAKKFKEEQAELAKSFGERRANTDREITSLQNLQSVINSGNSSLNQKKAAYLELQKLVPTLTGLTYEQATAQGKLNEYINDEITLIGLRSDANALESILTEKKKKDFEAAFKESEKIIQQQKERVSQAELNATLTDEEIKNLPKIVDAKQQEYTAESALLSINEEMYKLQLKQKGITDVQKAEAKKKVDTEIKVAETLQNTHKKTLESQVENLTRAEKQQIESDKQEQERQKEKSEKKKADDEKTTAENVKADEKAFKEKQALQDAEFQLVSTTIDALQTINQAATDYEIGQLDEQLRKGLISREQYEKQVRKIKHDAAERDKGLALFNIALSTAEAIMKAYTVDPTGLLALAAGIAGGAEFAAVALKPIPAFEKGTKKAPPGFKWVGEKGKELIHTPGGDTIFDHKKSLQIAQMFDTPNLILPEYYSTISNTKDFDYDKLGKAIAKNIPANKLPEITITDNSGLIAYHKKYHG